ncbi:MAG TPA: lipopolysaccharide assembly protein LapB [Quisquiliibacterium sp.]|nr:lipopolysaccharide assembly protein LapB [Quisquiliibacterium sp.]
MELELWWLLAIPLFFGLGWFAARIDQRGGGASAGGHLPDAYFRGLNFLLNEQHDKAIDAFIDVVKLDPETVELHFALGNLFRRRGETDRAIRVHLSLAERTGLDAHQREHAVYELGQDYLKAGLLDRAEDAFNRLDGTRYAASALRHRLEIAQMVRDWPAAIALADRLRADGGGPAVAELAHFHCELAARALAAQGPQRFEDALRALDAALQIEPTHARALLMKGELMLAEGDPRAAVQAWRSLLAHRPEHLSLVAVGWLDAHRQLGEVGQGIATLADVHARHPSADAYAAILDAKVEREGRAAALRWGAEALRSQPSVLALDRWLHVRLQGGEGTGAGAGDAAGEGARAGAGDAAPDGSRDGGTRDDDALARRAIQSQVRRLGRYVCGHCGFKARQFYWHCPGCGRWDAYAPKRSEELERG